ncbi:hypothetical protein ACTI_76680 [Actinoplanes sp. OR16]|nr:hypothetical protein [Actinoplanes sp. OR16]BBH70983.1 hypothetical protein ACTI_76680 [Actinoplanes sp. OR16]
MALLALNHPELIRGPGLPAQRAAAPDRHPGHHLHEAIARSRRISR